MIAYPLSSIHTHFMKYLSCVDSLRSSKSIVLFGLYISREVENRWSKREKEEKPFVLIPKFFYHKKFFGDTFCLEEQYILYSLIAISANNKKQKNYNSFYKLDL